jgi:general secretion pathway protein G
VSRQNAWDGVDRRRRLLVNRLQTENVVVQLGWIAAILALFVCLLLGPTVYELFGATGRRQQLAAGLFLDLHARLWPALIALAASLAIVIVVHSHRVVGPLVRFNAVFVAVTRGELWVPAKIRPRDYPQDESRALQGMLASLRQRIGDAQNSAARLHELLGQLPLSAAEEARLELVRLRQALDVYEIHAPHVGQPPSMTSPETCGSPTHGGYTLIEILLVVTMVGLISAIAVPGYEAALEKARVVRAIGDIRTVQNELQAHQLVNGCYPGTLDEIGYGSMRDPWGSAYVYGPLEGAPAGGGKGGGGKGGKPKCGACSGACLGTGQARKDRNLVPINSDFDFYSMGKDRQSVGPLTAKASQDDVVRASDGGFIGLGRDF